MSVELRKSYIVLKDKWASGGRCFYFEIQIFFFSFQKCLQSASCTEDLREYVRTLQQQKHKQHLHFIQLKICPQILVTTSALLSAVLKKAAKQCSKKWEKMSYKSNNNFMLVTHRYATQGDKGEVFHELNII